MTDLRSDLSSTLPCAKLPDEKHKLAKSVTVLECKVVPWTTFF